MAHVDYARDVNYERGTFTILQLKGEISCVALLAFVFTYGPKPFGYARCENKHLWCMENVLQFVSC